MSAYNFQDLTGKVFGQLTVIERAENTKDGKARWLCRCTCGNECVVSAYDLKRKDGKATTSCGCGKLKKLIERSTKHGMTGTKIYNKWCGMMERCYNPKSERHDCYGGRGIKVCERWHVFENFYDDVSKLENFGRAGYTLDRIRVNEDYKPDNVRWADRKTQARNRRSNIMVEYEGVQMCLMDAAEKSGINYKCLHKRYQRGLRGDDLFKTVKKD